MLLFGMSYICLQIFQLIGISHTHFLSYNSTFIVQSAGPVIAVLPIVANEAGSDLPFATGLVTISSVLFVFVIPIIMEILTLVGIGT